MKKHTPKHSYGIVAYLRNPFRVLLAHPGGPYTRKGDLGNWGIPKGVSHQAEGGWKCAVREFSEETGLSLPHGLTAKNIISLGTVTQLGGKIVKAWAVEMKDDDISGFKSNTFEMEWPPDSGKTQKFPEIDKIEYFSYMLAIRYIKPAQAALLERLVGELNIIS